MAQLAEFVGNHPYLAAFVVVSLAAVIVYELRLRQTGTTQVSASDAIRLINKGALVIDVRGADEYAGGHIVNSRNIALETLEKDPGAVKKPKDKVLLAVCDNGLKGSKAAALLRRHGFEHAFSLQTGLRSWRADNLPLVK